MRTCVDNPFLFSPSSETWWPLAHRPPPRVPDRSRQPQRAPRCGGGPVRQAWPGQEPSDCLFCRYASRGGRGQLGEEAPTGRPCHEVEGHRRVCGSVVLDAHTQPPDVRRCPTHRCLLVLQGRPPLSPARRLPVCSLPSRALRCPNSATSGSYNGGQSLRTTSTAQSIFCVPLGQGHVLRRRQRRRVVHHCVVGRQGDRPHPRHLIVHHGCCSSAL